MDGRNLQIRPVLKDNQSPVLLFGSVAMKSCASERAKLSGFSGMPVLKREVEVFPETVFGMSGRWWVAHVRSRQEKSLARYLLQHEIAYYLPQIEKKTKRGYRTITSYLPLFPGYLFFCGFERQTSRALRSQVVVKLLAPFDQLEFENDLRQLYELQQSNARLTLYPHLRSGDSVLITEGVFAGYQGVIVRERSEGRLIVSVSFIRQSVAVEIDRDSIRPRKQASGL
jgi:transcription antitermination factor NusG